MNCVEGEGDGREWLVATRVAREVGVIVVWGRGWWCSGVAKG